MKYRVIRWVGLSFLLGITPVKADNSQTGTGEVDGYKLVWQDLFDGDVLNEEENWEIEVNGDGGGNRELQYYRRENVSMGEEPVSRSRCLILTAKKENYMGKTVTSGRLTTQKKMSFTHGKIEARIKLPKTENGLWPAFWLLGNTISSEGWPRCGEIDILEMGHANGIRNNTQDRYFNGACHWGYYENGGYPNYAKSSTNAYSLQDDFHLFTMIWDGDKIAMYVDKDRNPDVKPYYEMNISDRSDSKSPGNYFHRNFFVIFNLAVGGNFPQIWNIDQITALKDGEAKMYVDYVKVYQKGGDDESFSWVGETSGTEHLTAEQTDKPEIFYSSSKHAIGISEEAKEVSVYTLDGNEIKHAKNVSWIQLPLVLGCSGVCIVKIKTAANNVYACKLNIR